MKRTSLVVLLVVVIGLLNGCSDHVLPNGTKIFGERTLKDGSKEIQRIEHPDGQKQFDVVELPDGTQKSGRIEFSNGEKEFDVVKLPDRTVKSGRIEDADGQKGKKQFNVVELPDGTRKYGRIEFPNGEKEFDVTLSPDGTRKVGVTELTPEQEKQQQAARKAALRLWDLGPEDIDARCGGPMKVETVGPTYFETYAVSTEALQKWGDATLRLVYTGQPLKLLKAYSSHVAEYGDNAILIALPCLNEPKFGQKRFGYVN